MFFVCYQLSLWAHQGAFRIVPVGPRHCPCEPAIGSRQQYTARCTVMSSIPSPTVLWYFGYIVYTPLKIAMRKAAHYSVLNGLIYIFCSTHSFLMRPSVRKIFALDNYFNLINSVLFRHFIKINQQTGPCPTQILHLKKLGLSLYFNKFWLKFV